MNGKNLLIGLSHIDRKFIEESENDTVTGKSGANVEAQHVRKIFGRPVLVAAIIALMLFLMGCAVVYVMRMQDLHIGEHRIIQSQNNDLGESVGETEIQLDVLSLQGIKDSPNYLANQEWLQFTEGYTPELGEYWESDEAYWAYSVQNQVMVDKLDEICAKYGLNVIGKPWHEHVDCNQFLPLVGVDHLLKEDSAAAIHIPQGRFFPGGSFNVYGNLTLPDVEMPLYDLSLNYIQKDVFYDVFAYVDSSTVTERSYTTADGVSLLLLESETSGMILADREDCFITLSISLRDGVSLEEIAEQFDFTIQAKSIDAAAADAREQASIDEANADDPSKGRFVRDTYGEYVEDLLWSDSQMRMNGYTEEEINEKEYAFYDLDGNGEEDLLIFYDGYIHTVVGWKNGKTDEGKTYDLQLCEDNVLIEEAENVILGETWYHIFYFANNGETVFSNPKEQSIVRLKNDHGTWWRTSSTDHYADFDTQITEEEALEILNSYKPVTLNTRPLSQFEEPQR